MCPFFCELRQLFDLNKKICDNTFMENNIRHVVHSFEPIISGECEALILGSVPSVMSMQNNFYYMHPRNRFWLLMEKILGEELVNCIPQEKTNKLLKSKIGLYDSIFECDIYLSSDSKISSVIPSDIPSLIKGTNVKKILCNGGVSYNILIKNYPDLLPMAVKMPSTSPANAAFSFDKLIAKWSKELSAFSY